MNNKVYENFLVFDVRSGAITHDRLTEIALVVVRNGEIFDKLFWNVKPPVNPAYERDFRQNSEYPRLPEVWREAEPYFSQVSYCTAYNLSVHKSNLEKSLAHYGIAYPDRQYFCAYAWANEVGNAVELRPYRKRYAAAGGHMEKAEATAELVLALQRVTGKTVAERVSDLARKKMLGAKSVFQWEAADVSGLVWSDMPVDAAAYWAGRTVVVTGEFEKYPDRNELVRLLEAKGSKVVSAISGKTNTVLIGEGAGPSKVEKIQTLLDSGKVIDLFNQHQLSTLLNPHETNH